MKKTVIYARYSSDNQTEQSIEGQMRVCKEYAEKNDFIIVNEYVDRAMTGTNDKRPALQQMLYDSKKKGFQYVLVYKLNRFSRSRYDSAINRAVLEKNGVKLLSVTEPISDTPEGIILDSMLTGMAEYYSAELSQKGGRTPYGYNVKDKKLSINEQQANNRSNSDYSNYRNSIFPTMRYHLSYFC